MVKDDSDRPSANKTTLWLLCALAVIDGMDLQLLPASFRALEAQLGMGPYILAALVVCQDVAFAVSAPFWASLADNGFSRKLLLAAGATGWGLLTLLLAFVSSSEMMVVLRILNGACLGLLMPISQSIIAEQSPNGERGYNFGWIQFCGNGGQTLATLCVTSVSNIMLFGIAGWRVAFIFVAFLSLALAVLVMLFMEEKSRPWTPEYVGIVIELRKFISYFKIPTFGVIVLQGMFGTIPAASLSFATMYFQYLGMVDWQAAAIFSMFVLGSAFGGLLGGGLGDRLAAFSRNHGRVITAQTSVLLGIPVVAIVFNLRPAPVWSLGSLMFTLGIVSSWCLAGCNRPVFCEIVPAGSQASAMAWEFCLEHTSGNVIGPVAVSFISKNFYNYQVSRRQVTDMPVALRKENAKALGGAITCCTVLPWIVCFISYGLLHFTYKHDRKLGALQQKDEIDPLSEGKQPADADERTRLVC